MTQLSIVIPVFNALDETLDCVASVLASDAGEAQILLMDDGSHNHVSVALVERFKAHENIRVISHFRNRGYTRNINFGVMASDGTYVCILNSDTLVPEVWSAPLIAELEAQPGLAGVGPASNAASYQSVPQLKDPTGGFSVNEGLGFDPVERANVNRILMHFTQGRVYDLPILNGFCTIFRRTHLDAVGAFDVESFPQGYGEENDLCARIKAKGFRLGYVPSVFVHHQKSKSFGESRKKALSKLGAQTLREKYGTRLIRSFAEQMEDMPELAAIRRLVASVPSQAVAEKELRVGETHRSAAGQGSTLVKVAGPASVTISEEAITVKAPRAKPVALLTLNSSPESGITVELPEGVELPLSDKAPQEALLDWLSLVSYETPVVIEGWRGLEQTCAARQYGMLYAAQ